MGALGAFGRPTWPLRDSSPGLRAFISETLAKQLLLELGYGLPVVNSESKGWAGQNFRCRLPRLYALILRTCGGQPTNSVTVLCWVIALTPSQGNYAVGLDLGPTKAEGEGQEIRNVQRTQSTIADLKKPGLQEQWATPRWQSAGKVYSALQPTRNRILPTVCMCLGVTVPRASGKD